MTGNDEVTLQQIAAQHERLFKTFEQIREATNVPDDHPVLIVLFEELSALVIEHFRDEEAVMSRIAYPERNWHYSQHQRLAADLEVIKHRVRTGTGGLSKDDFARLHESMKAHTKNADDRFPLFVASKSLGGE